MSKQKQKQKQQSKQKQLKAYARRRARRPPPLVTLLVTNKVGNAMFLNHADLLYRIESCILKSANEGQDIDDRWIERWLRLTIRDQIIDDDQMRWAQHRLNAVRRERADISDVTWRDALRVVYGSLQFRSDCEAGEYSYLGYLAEFIGGMSH